MCTVAISGMMMTMTTADSELQIAEAVFGNRYEEIKRYVDILTTRGVEWGLLGPKETSRVWERHVLNSVAVGSLIPEGCRLADVGSGAGLPGVPLAILREDLRVTLIEPLLRRSNFLTQIVDELGLADRVEVLRTRAEDCDSTFDVVTARAVAKLPTLIGWTKSLFLPDGQLLAVKGISAEDEVKKAQKVLKSSHLDAEVLVVRAHPEAEVTHVVRVVSSAR
jgi:16S rRNA (guanine527-N7)-methyltransferase